MHDAAWIMPGTNATWCICYNILGNGHINTYFQCSKGDRGCYGAAWGGSGEEQGGSRIWPRYLCNIQREGCPLPLFLPPAACPGLGSYVPELRDIFSSLSKLCTLPEGTSQALNKGWNWWGPLFLNNRLGWLTLIRRSVGAATVSGLCVQHFLVPFHNCIMDWKEEAPPRQALSPPRKPSALPFSGDSGNAWCPGIQVWTTWGPGIFNKEGEIGAQLLFHRVLNKPESLIHASSWSLGRSRGGGWSRTTYLG